MIVMDDELLTVEEVAQILKMHPYTIRRLLREGKLPGTKITGLTGSSWRVKRSDLNQRIGGQQETNSKSEES